MTEGALGNEALSSGQHLEQSTEHVKASLFVQPRPEPIRLVQSGQPLSPVKAPSPLKGELPPNVLEALSELKDRYSFGPPTGTKCSDLNSLIPTTFSLVTSVSFPEP